MNFRSGRITHVTLASQRTIALGGTITVFGIVIANTAGAATTVTIQDAATDDIIVVQVPANDTKIIDIEWVADAGLILASDAEETLVSVFHSQVGS